MLREVKWAGLAAGIALLGLAGCSLGADEEKAFALKFAFCRHLASDARLALLERRRAGLQDRLTEARGTTPRRGDRYIRSLAEHRTESTARDVAWLDELIAAERRTAHPEHTQEGATAS
jgi:hypothetical protein